MLVEEITCMNMYMERHPKAILVATFLDWCCIVFLRKAEGKHPEIVVSEVSWIGSFTTEALGLGILTYQASWIGIFTFEVSGVASSSLRYLPSPLRSLDWHLLAC